jgi:hypothetical protein
MMQVKAFYYDGTTSRKKEVNIYFEPPGYIRITGLESESGYSLSEIRISQRVSRIPRTIYLPDGAKCETDDNNAVDEFLRQSGQNTWDLLLNHLESNLKYVIAALIVAITGLWGFIEIGIPAAAKRAAFSLPSSVNTTLGGESLEIMDRLFMSQSHLGSERQKEVDTVFENLTEELSSDFNLQLVFRKSDQFGANAFALPSGTVIVTDDLVNISEHRNELLAIFVHEIGHIVNRHTLRLVLQNSIITLLIASVTGDITSISAVAAALPVVLVESKYSRKFESEADIYALEYLRSHDIPGRYFADILTRMEQESDSGGNVPNYLSSHPDTSERLKLFQDEQ